MNRLNKILISILILLIFNSCQKPVQDKISKSEIYNFLNEIIPTLTSDNTDCDVIREEPILTIYGKRTVSENNLIIKNILKKYKKNGWIKRKDIDYIISQQNDSTFLFKQNLLNKKLISRHTLDSIFSLPNTNAYYTLYEELNIATFGKISKPFFTIDKKTAIVVFEIYRNYLNAEGYILIYKNIDGEWSEFKRTRNWIS